MPTKNPRIRKLVYFISIALLIAAMAFVALGVWPYAKALLAKNKSWQQLNDIIVPHLSVATPADAGPFPVVLVIPGCEGVYPGRTRLRMHWLVEQGYIAVMVDSHKGRNLDNKEVCHGRALWGRERAGDIYVALNYARQLPKADTDNIALLGYSHGGWSILDALSYDGQPPYALDAAPSDILQSVKGAIVYYPYCDFPARARSEYNSTIPLLALHGATDTVVNPRSCDTMMKSWQERKLPVTSITYPNTGHGFDILTHKNFLPDIHNQALDEVSHFLKSLFAAQSTTKA